SPQRGKRGCQRLRGKGRIGPPHLQPPLDQEERQRGGCRVPGAGSPQESGERDEEERRSLVGEGDRDEARRQGSIPKYGRREQEPEKERAAARARLGPAEQPDSRERKEHRSGVAERHARPVLPLLLHRTAAVDSVCERQDRRPETANRLSGGDGLAHPSPRDRRASGRILGGVRHGLEQRNEERRREKKGQQSGRSGGGESP